MKDYPDNLGSERDSYPVTVATGEDSEPKPEQAHTVADDMEQQSRRVRSVIVEYWVN
jgi:hypothetical protein